MQNLATRALQDPKFMQRSRRCGTVFFCRWKIREVALVVGWFRRAGTDEFCDSCDITSSMCMEVWQLLAASRGCKGHDAQGHNCRELETSIAGLEVPGYQGSLPRECGEALSDVICGLRASCGSQQWKVEV